MDFRYMSSDEISEQMDRALKALKDDHEVHGYQEECPYCQEEVEKHEAKYTEGFVGLLDAIMDSPMKQVDSLVDEASRIKKEYGHLAINRD